MVRMFTTAFLLAAMLIPATAFAQNSDEEVPTKFYPMESHFVDGEIRAPKIEFSSTVQKAKFDRLIRLKQSFKDRVVESAQESAL